MEFTSSQLNSVLILFGSETGTAEALSYKLSKSMLRLHGLPSRVYSMDDYDISNLPEEKFVVMIVATAGDGETPANMRSFWRFLLNKRLGPDSLQGLTVGVFGLGDSSYIKFNAAARRMSARLKQLGANHCVPLGLGDDQAGYGYYTAWNDWIEACLTAIADRFPADKFVTARSATDEHTDYSVEVITGMPEGGLSSSTTTGQFYHASKPPGTLHVSPTAHDPLVGELVENRRLTAATWPQDVRHLSIRLPPPPPMPVNGDGDAENGGTPTFRGGDVAVVYPENSDALVTAALTIVLAGEAGHAEGRVASSLTGHSLLKITRHCNPLSTAPPRRTRLPSLTCSLDTLLRRHLDIGGVPHRPFFEELARFATDATEAEKLLELGSAEGTDLYFDYCVREKKSFVECMCEFPSARPPLQCLLELLPVLQPRQFSVASSSLAAMQDLHLCVGVLQKTTPYGRERTGVCSGYLCSLPPGATVRLWLRRGTFRSPACHVPLVLVGPGTGVAPMRALLQERLVQCEQRQGQHDRRETMEACHNVLLFYGCRKRDSDYLYKDEWSVPHGFIRVPPPSSSLSSSPATAAAPVTATALERHSTHGDRFGIQLAFSRDNADEPAPYVTHHLRRRGAEVWAMLARGGQVFVAGSANHMPADVKKAVTDVVAEHGAMSSEEATAFVAAMARRGHYYTEAWS